MRLSIYLLILGLFCTCQVTEKPTVVLHEVESPAYARVPGRLGLLHEMQGRWKDRNIKGAELLISGNKFVSIYKGEVRARARVEAFAECPPSCPQGKHLQARGFFVVYREDGEECYVLTSLKNGQMEYALLE